MQKLECARRATWAFLSAAGATGVGLAIGMKPIPLIVFVTIAVGVLIQRFYRSVVHSGIVVLVGLLLTLPVGGAISWANVPLASAFEESTWMSQGVFIMLSLIGVALAVVSMISPPTNVRPPWLGRMQPIGGMALYVYVLIWLLDPGAFHRSIEYRDAVIFAGLSFPTAIGCASLIVRGPRNLKFSIPRA